MKTISTMGYEHKQNKSLIKSILLWKKKVKRSFGMNVRSNSYV